jgi:limonene 1,2-monooxygenase
MVADRMVLLDHLTRGRVMLGVGPGVLTSDAKMLGINTLQQRERMDESLGIIIRLFTETEPITYKSDWFELHDAMLQLRPYQRPHMPIAVAASQSPAGPSLAGKYGTAILGISVPRETATEARFDNLWDIAEESAAKHGKQVKREEWRLVVPVHLAESRKEAIEDARLAAGRFQREYMEHTVGFPGSTDAPMDKIIDVMVEQGSWIVGTPDDCIAGIRRLGERSGGFGGLLVMTQEWASREKVFHSYELLARYVMPHFQGTLEGLNSSNQWSQEHIAELADARVGVVERAQQRYAEQGT